MTLLLAGFFILTNGAVWYFGAGTQRSWVFALCCLTGFVIMLLARLWMVEERFSVPILMTVALVARLIAFVTPPLLSEDIHRYLWDGKLVASGVNPYDYRPLDPTLQTLRDESYNKINSRHWYSVYPPLLQILFGASWKVFGPTLWGWKLIALVADLFALGLLWKLLRDWTLPRSAFAYYAWNPLVIWEAVGSAHSEVIMVPLVLLALLLWRRNHAAAGTCWGLSILAKLVPALGLVWLFARSRLAAWTAVVTAVAGGIVFLRPHNIAHFLESLMLYPKFFAFNSLLYRMMLAATRASGFYWENKIGYGMAIAFAVLFVFISRRALLSDQESATAAEPDKAVPDGSPSWLRPAFLDRSNPDAPPRQLVLFLQQTFTLYLILSPVVHPWYFLLLAWTLAIAPRPSLLWLNGALPFSYSAYNSSPPRDLTSILAVEYIPFLLLWLWEIRRLNGEVRVTNDGRKWTRMNADFD